MKELSSNEIILNIIRDAIQLLDTLWIYGADDKFNTTIDTLQLNINSIEYLKIFHAKIATYRCIFSIKNHPTKNKNIVSMIRNHIIDLWRIMLLELHVEVQYKVIELFRNKQKNLGMYIKSLQDINSCKNKASQHLRTKIKMLTKIVKNNLTEVIHDYELIDSSKYFSNWFN
jgi:hypothetical protein